MAQLTCTDVIGMILSDVPVTDQESVWLVRSPYFAEVSAYVNSAYAAGKSRQEIASALGYRLPSRLTQEAPVEAAEEYALV